MNRSEKLLEAIGQIDDRLILDAEKAGGKNAAQGSRSVSGGAKKKSHKKKVITFRYRSALAACAVLVICVGVYGLLAAKGLILSPFTGSSDSSQETRISESVGTDTSMDVATAEGAAADTAAEEAAADTTADDAAIADEAAQEDIAEVENLEKENAESESVGQMEPAQAQEPMVTSLQEDEETPAYDPGQVTDLPAPKLEVKLVKASGTDVTLSFSNQYTDATVTYGSMYELERQTQSGWSSVAARDNVAWKDVLYGLEAGKSTKETIHLATMFGELEAGHYRLVKNCTVIAADQSEEEIVIYTEFDIVK